MVIFPLAPDQTIAQMWSNEARGERQWMDDIEEWSGCSYIQLKEMSQDSEQWRRKTIKWSSAVANRHRRWSTSEPVSCVATMTLFNPLTPTVAI